LPARQKFFLSLFISCVFWRGDVVKTSIDTTHEICAISQLFPRVFSSFEHSFSLMKAYTNLHEAIPALSNTTVKVLKDFSPITPSELKKNGGVARHLHLSRVQILVTFSENLLLWQLTLNAIVILFRFFTQVRSDQFSGN